MLPTVQTAKKKHVKIVLVKAVFVYLFVVKSIKTIAEIIQRVSIMFASIQWYVSRLQAMSLSEILPRIQHLALKKYLRGNSSWTAPVPKTNTVRADWWKPPDLPLAHLAEYTALLDEAEQYREGRYSWLNIPCQESPPNWHLDPQTNRIAPMSMGLDLNYRDRNLVGNVKNIWEKNRHHHLTVMSAAYLLTKNEAYADAVAKQLQDWIINNPFPLGINWTSSLELGIRLISWVWIDRFLRGSKAHSLLFGESGILWSSIYWHQWLIAKHYSHGSSANNHLVGEMAGLFISSSHWSVFDDSKRWQSLAWVILETEIPKQTFASGLNREQAFSYHIFVTEFFLLAGIEAQGCDVEVSQPYRNNVRRMLEVVPPLMDAKGNLPRYGDGDEGMALQIRPHQSSRLNWLFRLGRQWLGAKVPLPNSDSGCLAASFINLPAGDRDPVEASALPDSLALPDAGLYVLAQNRGKPQEILCLADAGKLGFLPLAAHGHADALSFTLNVSGVPIIVDPGTYTYHADAHWRSYFRSTKAHNTVVVDGLDQSESAGTFLWTKQANTRVIDWQTTTKGAVLIAEHDGYTRLRDRIIHRRKLTLEQQELEIEDRLQNKGTHQVEWRLHFAPQCEVELKSECCLVKWHSGLLAIYLDEQMEWSLLKGASNGGWYSPGFNLKQPTTTLVGRAKVTGNLVLNNSIDLLEQNLLKKSTVTEVVVSS